MMKYFHHVPGRLRTRLSRLKRNPAYAGKLQSALEGLQGVRDVRINLVTGSLLVIYDPQQISLATLQQAIPQIPQTCPLCSAGGHNRAAATAVTAGLGDKLMSMAVEAAMTRMLGALL